MLVIAHPQAAVVVTEATVSAVFIAIIAAFSAFANQFSFEFPVLAQCYRKY